MSTFEIVAALDERMGIGKGGDLPWRLPADMAHFKALTLGAPSEKTNAVIMGRNTWASIPDKFRPLPGRQNVVLTRQPDFRLPDGVVRAKDLDTALASLGPDIDRVFVIGGGQVYREAIADPRCRGLYLTRVAGDFHCDTTFPPIPESFPRTDIITEATDRGIDYRIEHWTR